MDLLRRAAAQIEYKSSGEQSLLIITLKSRNVWFWILSNDSFRNLPLNTGIRNVYFGLFMIYETKLLRILNRNIPLFYRHIYVLVNEVPQTCQVMT